MAFPSWTLEDIRLQQKQPGVVPSGSRIFCSEVKPPKPPYSCVTPSPTQPRCMSLVCGDILYTRACTRETLCACIWTTLQSRRGQSTCLEAQVNMLRCEFGPSGCALLMSGTW